jgi:hypothetical protein
VSAEDDLAAFEREFVDYDLAPLEHPWATSWAFDGTAAMAPRRPEVLGDTVDVFWGDLTTWVVWLQATFKAARWFPPCWPQHPALVEELLGLWFAWQHAWLPSADPNAPIGWVRELGWALDRVERLWKVPCGSDGHRDQPDPVLGADGIPALHHWWSNPNYPEPT